MTDYLSASQLVMFQRCGEQWRRRFIDEDFVPPSLPVRTGHAVREAAMLCLRHRLETGTLLPLDAVQDAAADAYARILTEGVYFAPEDLPSARRALSEGRDSAVTLAALFRNSLAPDLDPVLVEHRVELSLGLALPVIVTIDCLTRNGEAHHLVTSSKRWSAERVLASPDSALLLHAVRQLTGVTPQRLPVDVLVGTRTPVLQTLESPSCDLMVVLRAFRLMLAAVAAGIFPPAAPDSWICSPRWCGYFFSCPHVAAHRKVLPAGLRGAGVRMSVL